jgi:hypothetical protein
MPGIDIAAVPQRKGPGHPSPFDAPCAEGIWPRLRHAGERKPEAGWFTGWMPLIIGSSVRQPTGQPRRKSIALKVWRLASSRKSA